MNLFTQKWSISSPLLVTKKSANVKEYMPIEEAFADLENDSNVSKDKIEKLRSSLKKLKNKTSILIRNGEIING